MMFREIDEGLCQEPVSDEAMAKLNNFCEAWGYDKTETLANWVSMAKACRDNLTWSKIENQYISDEYRNSDKYQRKLANGD